MENKAKMMVFVLLIVAATVAAFIQGSTSEGSGKIVLFILGFLGIASLAMGACALHGSRRGKR
ncbi:hypothetical protein [Streptomyces sp. NPDC048266]|uniref:hypothetical protein n=1 Tax=Streptomyces sp. NPDC048266 TaxID=3155787 RepID=UPI0033EA0763